MANTPHKVVRFVVWSSTSRDNRDDALMALDEGFEIAESKFGIHAAHVWAYWQGIRSIPFGLIALILKVGSTVWRIGN